MIRSEDGKLVGFVFVDTTRADRPTTSTTRSARSLATSQLPAGVRIAWVGQFQYLERAKAKLQIVVPITLLIVFFLLYLNTRSLVETGIVLLAVPFSLVGAIWLIYLLDYNVSVAVWVGMIALAGLDAETGVVMLLYLTLAHRRWQPEGRLRTRGRSARGDRRGRRPADPAEADDRADDDDRPRSRCCGAPAPAPTS